ncbi:MAG: hypothetical protein ACJ8F7_18525 [Gemmataceae bacterium]
MLRRVLATLAVCGFFAAAALAEDYKGTLKKIDAEKSTITVLVNGEEKTLPVSKDAEIYSQGKGKKKKPGPKEVINGGLSGLKSDMEVTVSTIRTGSREVVGSIKVEKK